MTAQQQAQVQMKRQPVLSRLAEDQPDMIVWDPATRTYVRADGSPS